MEQFVFDVWTKPLGPTLMGLTGTIPIHMWPESVKGKPVDEWSPEDVEQFGDTGKSLAVLYHLRDVALDREKELDWLRGGTKERDDKSVAPVKLKLSPAANAVKNVIDTIRNDKKFTAVEGFTDLHQQMAEMAQATYLHDQPEKLSKYVDEVSSLGANGWEVDWKLSNDLGTVFTNKNKAILPNLAWRGSEPPTKNIRDWGKNVMNALGYENLLGSTRKHINNIAEAVGFTDAMNDSKVYRKINKGLDFMEKQNIRQNDLQILMNETHGEHTNSGHSKGGGDSIIQGRKHPNFVKKSYVFNSSPVEGMEALGEKLESWTVQGDVVSAAHQESNHRKGLNRQIKPRLGVKFGPFESHKIEHYTGCSLEAPSDVSEILPENPNLFKKIGGSVVRGVANTGLGVGKGLAAGFGADFILNKLGLGTKDIGELSHVGLTGSLAEAFFRGTKGIVSAAPSAFVGAVVGTEVNKATKDWNPVARATTSTSAAVMAQRLGVAGTSLALEGAGAAVGGEIGAGIASLAAETSLLGPMGWVGAALEIGIGSVLMLGFNTWEDHERAVAEEKQEMQRRLSIKEYVKESEGMEMELNDKRIDEIEKVYDRDDVNDYQRKLEYLNVLYPDEMSEFYALQDRIKKENELLSNASAVAMNQAGFQSDEYSKYNAYLREQARERDSKALDERRKRDAAYERTHTVKDANGVDIFRGNK